MLCVPAHGLEPPNTPNHDGHHLTYDRTIVSLAFRPAACVTIRMVMRMQVRIGIDPASSEFFRQGSVYDLNFKADATCPTSRRSCPTDDSGKKSSAEMIEIYKGLLAKYDIIFLEGEHTACCTLCC